MHSVKAVSFSFIWGLTENYSLGDNLSDSSQEPLRRGVGRLVGDFGEGGTCNQAHILVGACL